MEGLIEKLEEENSELKVSLDQAYDAWNEFSTNFNSGGCERSPLSCFSRNCVPIVMTAEKRAEMQVHKQQACMTEVRIQAKLRDRQFLHQVSHSLQQLEQQQQLPADDKIEANSSVTGPAAIESQSDKPAHTQPKRPESPVVRAPKIHRRRRTSSTSSTCSEASTPLMHPPEILTEYRGGFSSGCSSPVPRIDHGLKRSGSERSLKRSGSDRSLRRTGSGDIPAAIKSESAPRMGLHRRAGSGDMIYNNRPLREQVANKLTRSYDMSLRSLMTEELQAIPLPLTTKFLERVRMDRDASEGTNTDKSVPVIKNPRPSPPIKKQSPNKLEVAGPPQPIRAIHSLPPSRENTFDGLPQPPSSPKIAFDSPAQSSTNFLAVDTTKYSYTPPRSPLAQTPSDSSSPYAAPTSPAMASPKSPESACVPDRKSPVLTPRSSPVSACVLDRKSPVLTPRSSPVSASSDQSSKEASVNAGTPTESREGLTELLLNSTDPEKYARLLQNASDSVKQKVAEILHQQPVMKAPAGGAERHIYRSTEQQFQVKAENVQASASSHRLLENVDPEAGELSDSVDDTLRGTSPIADEEELPSGLSDTTEFEFEPALVIANKPSLIRSNSYTVDEPSAALQHSESKKSVDQLSPGRIKSPETLIPTPDRSKQLPSSTKYQNPGQTTPKYQNPGQTAPKESSDPEQGDSLSASERRRAAASRSYTLEAPSPALLDSLNASERSSLHSSESRSSFHKKSQRRLENFFSDTQGAMTPEQMAQHTQSQIQKYIQSMKASTNVTRPQAWASSAYNTQSSTGFPTSPTSEVKADCHSALATQCLQELPKSSPESGTSDKENEASSLVKEVPSDTPAVNKSTSKQDIFKQVRKELTLLKSKYAKKLTSYSDSRPASAEPSSVVSLHSAEPERPHTAIAHIASHVLSKHQAAKPHVQHQLTDKELQLMVLREKILTSPGRPQGSGLGSPGQVKSFADKEATPITSVYNECQQSMDSSLAEYSSYGGIHSASHTQRKHKIVSPTSSNATASQTSAVAFSTRQGSLPKLSALVRGHLCRKLYNTNKVKSIRKTVIDCKNLFATSQPQPNSLQDLHFQERLIEQWQVALLEIHTIFFELPIQKQIELIKQSEMVETQAKLRKMKERRTGSEIVMKHASVVRKNSLKSNSSISSRATKLFQRSAGDGATRPTTAPTFSKPTVPAQTPISQSTVLKKPTLAPKLAASSPLKSSTAKSQSGSKPSTRVARNIGYSPIKLTGESSKRN